MLLSPCLAANQLGVISSPIFYSCHSLQLVIYIIALLGCPKSRLSYSSTALPRLPCIVLPLLPLLSSNPSTTRYFSCSIMPCLLVPFLAYVNLSILVLPCLTLRSVLVSSSLSTANYFFFSYYVLFCPPAHYFRPVLQSFVLHCLNGLAVLS